MELTDTIRESALVGYFIILFVSSFAKLFIISIVGALSCMLRTRFNNEQIEDSCQTSFTYTARDVRNHFHIAPTEQCIRTLKDY